MKLNNLLLYILTILLLSACATERPKPVNEPNRFSLNIEYDDSPEANNTQNFEESKIVKKTTGNENVPQFSKPGNLPKKMGQSKKSFLKSPHKKVKISVEDIPLNKFIHLVFGEILKLNYSATANIERRKDSVTLRMDEKISSKKFYSVVEGILANYNISISSKDGVLFLSSGGNQNKLKLDYKVSYGKKFQYNNVPSNEVVYQILPLSYISVAQARDVLQEFALSKDEARVYNMSSVNGLLIKDYASNIKKGVALINMLDHPYMKNKLFKLIYLEHIDVEKFDARLKKIFSILNIPVASTVRGEPIAFMPINEINALFVITDKKELIDTVLYWKKKLDNFDELDNKKQIFVYKTKNRQAKEVNDLLSKLLSNVKEKPTLKTKKSNIASPTKTDTASIPTNTKITVDEQRNMLIFYMLPSEYKTIFELLKKIDTKAQQVLIEVTIAEITLVDKLQYGIEWYLQNTPSKDGTNIIAQTVGNLGLGSGGITGVMSAKNVTALFNAFAQDNVLNILSSPKLVVLNNKTASFNVGTQVPIITSQSTASDLGANAGGTPTFVQNVTYTSTGISTSITPTITADNTLMLKINQTVSEAQNNNTSDISSPIIVNRSISTEVLLKHGEELIIGGLIKENKSNTESKVPFLGDIPWLGELFKTYSNTTDKTELLFIVKPYILDKLKNNDAIYNSFARITKFKE